MSDNIDFQHYSYWKNAPPCDYEAFSSSNCNSTPQIVNASIRDSCISSTSMKVCQIRNEKALDTSDTIRVSAHSASCRPKLFMKDHDREFLGQQAFESFETASNQKNNELEFLENYSYQYLKQEDVQEVFCRSQMSTSSSNLNKQTIHNNLDNFENEFSNDFNQKSHAMMVSSQESSGSQNMIVSSQESSGSQKMITSSQESSRSQTMTVSSQESCRSEKMIVSSQESLESQPMIVASQESSEMETMIVASQESSETETMIVSSQESMGHQTVAIAEQEEFSTQSASEKLIISSQVNCSTTENYFNKRLITWKNTISDDTSMRLHKYLQFQKEDKLNQSVRSIENESFERRNYCKRCNKALNIQRENFIKKHVRKHAASEDDFLKCKKVFKQKYLAIPKKNLSLKKTNLSKREGTNSGLTKINLKTLKCKLHFEACS